MYVSCGGIKLMIAWYTPEPPFAPKYPFINVILPYHLRSVASIAEYDYAGHSHGCSAASGWFVWLSLVCYKHKNA